MINMAPLPTWYELFHPLFMGNHIEQNIEDGVWSKKGQKSFYFSRSCYSLKVAIEAYMRAFAKNKVIIWVPIYFCSEAISGLDNDSVTIKFYKQDAYLKALPESLCELSLEGIPDLVLLVHYFGMENNDCGLLNFCEQNNIFMIEDAAHVLSPTGNIGNYGKIIFYSPHKTIPVPQGSVLVILENQKAIIKEVEIIEKEYRCLSIQERNFRWIAKKTIQKLLPQSFYRFIRDDNLDGNSECISDEHLTDIVALSNYSYRAICMYDLNRIKTIKQQKCDVCRRLESVLLANYSCKRVVPSDETSTPFYLYLEFESEEEAARAENDLNHYGIFCVTWPTFHSSVSSDEIVKWKNCRAFTIHSQLPYNKITSYVEKNRR